MFKLIVVCVLVMGLTLQRCNTGCLKCNSKNECIFCDVFNNYYLSGTSCAVSTLANCFILNGNGDCTQCGPTFYLDTSTKKCVAVDTAKTVQFCGYYGAGQACVKCLKGYFISGGKCEAVSKTVDNCDSYSDNGKCADCADGYIFNAARSGCVVNPNTANCSVYSFLDCKSCASGYVANSNFYFVNYQINSAALFADLRTFMSGGSKDWTAVTRCQKIQDINCLIDSALSFCTTCMPGYFLTPDKTCRAYPKPIIEGCATYSSLISCLGCQNGYYLESATKCTLITSEKFISDCSSYSTIAATVQCVQCSTSKFLNGNTCSPNNRIDSLNIANCKTTTVTADTCAVCNDAFTITLDGKKCLPVIANCKTYTSSSSTDTALTCQICNDSFYLNTDSDSVTSCVAGGIEGCVTYLTKYICTSCNTAAYYLSNFRCVMHLAVTNCITYSSSNFNQCVSCAAGYYPFTYTNTCSAITIITNCSTYTDANTCATCADGYFIQSNKCVSISATYPNCKNANKDATSCTNCADGYALKNLNTDKTCAQNHNYILDQCDTVASNISFQNIATAETSSCSICKENSFPFDLGNLFGCVSNSLLSTKGVASDSAITECLKYGNNNGNAICLQCPTYLNIAANGARSCVTTCDASTSTLIADNLDGSYNTCALYANTAYGLSNCGQAIKTYNSGIVLVCVKSGAQIVAADFDSLTSVDNASSWRDIDGTTVPRPDGAFFYTGIPTNLVSSTNTNNHDTQSDSTGAKNCELYWLQAANNLLCVRCKWGSSAKYVLAANKTQCALIDGCDTTVSYTGFSHKLNMVLSCHACTGGKFIQVTALSSDAVGFAFTNLANDIAVVQCVTPLAAGSTATVSQPVTVTNCLIYGWLPSYSGGTPTNAKGCLACKPGYTLSANFGTCPSAVNNCDTTKNYMANRCSVCTQVNANGADEWKALNDYNGAACSFVKSDNCLFADTRVAADVNGKYNCRLCKPGFWLNHDKVCEKITLPQCNDASGKTSFYVLPTNLDSVDELADYYAFKYLSKATTVSGCNTCATGFTSIKIPSSEKQCVLSPYVQANIYADTIPMKYITNCAKYNKVFNAANNGPVSTCAVCKYNKIPTADGTLCVDKILNCKAAKNSANTKCQTCDATHVQISGVCTLKNIVNCATYDETANVADLLCTACADGFVLTTNKKSCYAGNVTGCKTYSLDLPWACIACLASYNLVNTANSRTYCFKVNDESNCSALDISATNGLQGGLFKCNTCTVNSSAAFFPKAYATSDTTLVQSVCLSLNLVDKCTAYGTTATTVATNTFLCTACSNGFYINETKNACVARTIQPSGCTTFYVNKDKCQVCNASTFKTDDETDCVSFPNGILRCATYSNDTVCTSCHAPAYLSNNTCPLSTVISNCATYIGNYTCSGCANGFFLNNATSCIQGQASNCLTYSAINACATCEFTKGLRTDTNGVTNCVDKDLSNCDVSTNTFPFTCTQCKSGYYLASDGTCALPTTISKCVTYDSVTTCTQCDKTAVLSVDRKSCNDTMFAGVNDENCVDNQQVATPICSKCSPGSVFVNGTCSSCSNNTYSAGCFSCDPANQSSCFACRSGYYQTAKGTCVALINQNTINNTPSSTLIAQLFGLLAFLFLTELIS